jgi:ATP-binding cassette subfamily F protein uup
VSELPDRGSGDRKPVRKLSYKDQRDFDLLPGMIEDMETQIARAEKALTDPDLYSSDPTRFAQLMAEIDKTRTERDAAEERWLDLAEQVEALPR